MLRTINALNLPDYHGDKTDLELRFYANKSWTDSFGVRHIGGKVGSTNFFQSVACIVHAGEIEIPSVDVPTTTDAASGRDVKIFIGIYDDENTLVAPLLAPEKTETGAITAAGMGNLSYPDIIEFNDARSARTAPSSYYDYVLTLLDGYLMPDATSNNKGGVQLSLAPVGAPIAVGTNDTRMVVNLAQFGDSLSSAVTAIAGLGNPQTVLTISRAVSVNTLNVPRNIKLDVTGTGMITINAAQTFTINSMVDPGNRQIVTGAGAVRYGRGCVREMNVAWRLGSDATVPTSTQTAAAINELIASITANGAGTIHFPEGTWITNVTHILPSNTRLTGVGNNPNDLTGTTIQLATANIPIFKVGATTFNVAVANMTLDGHSLANAEGFRCEGTFPNSSGGIYFERVQFANCYDGFRILATGGWQVTQNVFVNCLFVNNSHSGYRCNTANTQTTFLNTNWSIPLGTFGMFLEQAGLITITGGEGAGFGIGSTFMNVSGPHVNVNFNSFQVEGCDYIIINNASDISGIFTVVGSLMQGIVKFNQSCTFDSFSSNYLSETFQDVPGVTAVVTLYGGYIRTQNQSGGNTVPAKVDAFTGGSLVITEQVATNGEFRHRLPSSFTSPAVLDGNPTTPQVSIGHYTALSESKRLLRLGRTTIAGAFDLYYDFLRHYPTGRLHLLGNQIGNTGLDTNFDITATGLTIGSKQVETNTVVAAAGITSNGNARSVVAGVGTVTIPVTTALNTATKIAAEFCRKLQGDAGVSAIYHVTQNGAAISLTSILPVANDAAANFTIENVTSAGITNSLVSTNTTPGAAADKITNIKRGAVTFDPASVGANSYSVQTITVPGAAVGDSVTVNPPAITAGLLISQPWVSAANTISIPFYNTTGSPINEPSGSWNYLLVR